MASSQRARVRFWLWITKVSGPTKTLHILNAEVVILTHEKQFKNKSDFLADKLLRPTLITHVF